MKFLLLDRVKNTPSNFIFSIKYFARGTENFLFFSILLSVLYLIIWNYSGFLKKIPLLSSINILLISCFLLLGYYALSLIPVETLHVDRWSVITSFWDTYFEG